MRNKLIFNWRFILTVFVTIIAVLFAMPNFIKIEEESWLPSKKVSLGLDLRGGSHLLLHVDFDNYMDGLFDSLVDNLRKELRSNRIKYENLHSKHHAASFSLKEGEDHDKVRKIINNFDSNLLIEIHGNNIKLSYSGIYLSVLKDKLIDQSIEIVRIRVDENGTKEPLIQRQGSDHILLQVPGLDDPSSLKNILGKTAKLTFHLVDNETDIGSALSGSLPSGSMLVKTSDNESRYAVIKKKVVVSGDLLSNASSSFHEARAVVNFEFNPLGARLFGEVTSKNPGKQLAIVLDNKLISSPMIGDAILGGKGFIHGNFTPESATELALLLRAGSLPAPLKIVEERTVGPNLGVDSINSGAKAAVIGFALVFIFMIWTYGILGLFANIALIIALIYIVAMLSMFQATLTLPGIAGIILTMGMAVDANVLIYERIREESKKDASVLYSIKCGFEFAIGTITDSNITTLIAALLLYIFGVGTIKGFAVTLSIGILASMFASIVITKLFIDIWIMFFKPNKISL